MAKRKINGYEPYTFQFQPPRKVGTFKKYIKPARKGYTTVPRTGGVMSFGEMKYFDTELPAAALTASLNWTGTEHDPTTTNEGTPVANPLTLFCPVVGSAINQRIGREAKVYKIKIHGRLNVPKQATQTTSDDAIQCRVILVQDMQTNALQMQGEQLMQDPVTNTAAMAINEFQSLANFGRFRVLKDKTYMVQRPSTMDSGTDAQQFGLNTVFKWNVKFRKPVSVRFNAVNAGTFADIVDNSFHVIAMSSTTDGAVTLGYASRVSYKEK